MQSNIVVKLHTYVPYYYNHWWKETTYKARKPKLDYIYIIKIGPS